MFKHLILLLTIISFLGLQSCKTLSKQSTKTYQKTTHKSIINQYHKHLFKAKSLKAQLNTVYKDNNRTQKVNINLRLKTDQAIWVSVSFLGITMAKAYITPQKIQYYEKLNRTYFDGSFDLLNKYLGINLNFKNLQSLILGETIHQLNTKEFNGKQAGNLYQLEPKTQHKLYNWLLTLNLLTHKLSNQKIEVDKHNNINVDYDLYQVIQNEIIPKKIQITINSKDISNNRTLTMSFDRIKLNENLSFPFKIPNGYKPLKL